MKKTILIIISALFVSCNSKNENSKLNQGWTFEKVTNVKSQGFKFEENIKSDKKSSSDKSETHKNCTAPCCSED